MSGGRRALVLHLAVLAVLLALPLVLPAYHATNLARIMVLAVFAMGYNIAFGYTGLLSLGHALFFAAGLYATGLLVEKAGLAAAPGFLAGAAAGAGAALLTGVLALRTSGMAFMIVTLMFAQAGYLAILYFGAVTRGDEGFVIARAGAGDRSPWTSRPTGPAISWRSASLPSGFWPTSRWCAPPQGGCSSPCGRMPSAAGCSATTPSATACSASGSPGLFAGSAGAAYGLLFGYVGATFASTQYSILPLLWVLLGGAGTVLGPFVGTLLMFYLVDLASRVTDAYLLVVGVGAARARALRAGRAPRRAARPQAAMAAVTCSRPAA